MTYDDALVNEIAARCTEVETGARNVDHILNRTLLPQLASEFLSRMAEGPEIKGVRIGVTADKNFRYDLT
jgi:type VI secretion system protein VasG